MYKNQLPLVPFYYVRHGQTDWNLENRAMGQKDIPLNDKGIEQARFARNSLINSGIATICHSPLSRARQTAEIFNEILNCNLIEIEELKEFNLGPYARKIKTQWFQDWRLGTHFEEVESYTDFIKRSLQGINQALNYPGPILIIAHGGVYWSIEHAIQIHSAKDLPNCFPVFHLPPQNQNEKWSSSFLS